jgi:ElaB/YqjD/DUF883 family membrane-anchored ribosome-binding protein
MSLTDKEKTAIDQLNFVERKFRNSLKNSMQRLDDFFQSKNERMEKIQTSLQGKMQSLTKQLEESDSNKKFFEEKSRKLNDEYVKAHPFMINFAEKEKMTPEKLRRHYKQQASEI